ncbi:A24 family peptidase [Paraurantiacibacter namhicola]|uniref:Type IV leader peptidase family protein n=1 Tax=Paraurantiacibacter namhicola TaxID=645517 RepID=A0A1C7DB07_9SPHN|nr:prepilin peptidase [Paraurantiacibacter namhicola]ANU08597.1 Type IV leader peptidase family protein [Paraurantiacibacter namhicola]
MLDDPIKYGLLALLALALVIAAFTDLKSRTIGNWLTGAVALGAPVFWWASGMALWPDIATQVGVALVTFAALAVLFAMRAMGGGDVKLLTALALWIQPQWFLQLLVMMALLGGVLTIVFAAVHMLRGRRERLAIPYGVAISMAGLWVLSSHYMPAAAQAAVMAP